MRALYEMHPVQRQARRRSDFRCAAIRSPVVLGGEQSNRLREISQPLTWCRDRVYDEAGNVIETHEHAGDFRERWGFPAGHKRNHEFV